MDLSQTLSLVRILGPKLPLILRVVITHILRLSPPSRYLSLRSEVTIAVLRALLHPSRPRPVTVAQHLSARDYGVKGRLWVSTYASPAPPETDARDALISAINSLAEPGLDPADVPDLTYASAVEAEWTGFRAGVASDAPPPPISESDKYARLMGEVTTPATVLYLHGGAYYLCDPASHRAITSKLARKTGGRCYSVRYRLAPQHPFPAALLDALVSYLTLLYPPPDAYHDAVKPEHIVISGDSAGGGLTFALVQLLLQLRRENAKVSWYGQLRAIPLPAGIACNSPWLDITQSAPAWQDTAPSEFDYLPKPAVTDQAASSQASCDVWPADPPRRRLYAADALVSHPLVSPLTARSWAGCPPVYICTGWELLAEEDRYFARRLKVDEGVSVTFEEYEAMPHTFALVLQTTDAARRCVDGWSGFVSNVVRGEEPESRAVRIKAPGLEEEELRFEELSRETDKEVRERVELHAGSPQTLARL